MSVGYPEPAGNGRRLLAYLFDNFAWILAIALLPPDVGIVALIAWIGWWVLLSTQGMSPGKKVAGLVCVDVQNGQAATFGKMLARDFLAKGLLGVVTFGVSGLIGTVQILGSNDRRALWDKMTDTLVVERAPVPKTATGGQVSVPVPVPQTGRPLPATAPGDSTAAPHGAQALTSKGPRSSALPPPPGMDATGLDDHTVTRGSLAEVRPAAHRWCITSSWGMQRVITEGTVVLVGRDPEGDSVATNVELEQTPPGARAVSKTHCLLRVGQTVVVEDRGSRNGTIIEPPGGRAVALRPHDPVPVITGTRVLLGDEWMQVDDGV